MERRQDQRQQQRQQQAQAPERRSRHGERFEAFAEAARKAVAERRRGFSHGDASHSVSPAGGGLEAVGRYVVDGRPVDLGSPDFYMKLWVAHLGWLGGRERHWADRMLEMYREANAKYLEKLWGPLWPVARDWALASVPRWCEALCGAVRQLVSGKSSPDWGAIKVSVRVSPRKRVFEERPAGTLWWGDFRDYLAKIAREIADAAKGAPVHGRGTR